MPIRGRNYLITGGAGAIGRVVAATLVEAGARVVLVDRDEHAAQQAAASLDGAVGLGGDLTDAEATLRLFEDAVIRQGPLDGVINVAGGFQFRPVVDTLPSDYDAMLDINLRTLYNTTRAALPMLRERGRGLIAGVSAAPGFERGAAGMALYSAAKSAVAAFLQGLAAELRPQGIGVSVVYPMGAVDTPANRAAMPDADPAAWIDPRDLGRAFVFAAAMADRRAIVELPVYPPR